METTTVAIDLAKDVFQVALANRAGRINRSAASHTTAIRALPRALTDDIQVIMESCGTSHYWGRRLQSRDVHVRLLPVQYGHPYLRRNGTDRADTDALLEVARCGDIRPVPVKTVEQQTLQAIHRIRTLWQTARVAAINAMRPAHPSC
jgi:transposase